MSLKQEIESWVEALNHYDTQDYEQALAVFEANADTSKIWFNIGMIYATLGEHERAVEAYQQATKLDQFLAIAYFQQGVSNFLLSEFQEALANFNEALLYLRGNTLIDYEQLGLQFRLYSCEVLFNRGLCYIYDGRMEDGMKDLEYASKEIQVEDHKVINDAIEEKADGYTVFSIPVGIIYRPNESKVRNVKAKDYLGKARLVAAADRADAFTGFTGSEVKKMQEGELAPKDDRAPNEISWAATNLVKTDLLRNRPSADIAATVTRDSPNAPSFPPTPPPEKDASGKPTRSNTTTSRANSVRQPPDLRERRREESRDQDREREEQPQYSPPARRGTMRDTPRRSASSASHNNPSRSGTVSSRRRQQERINEYSGGEEQYEDELYDLYAEPPRRGNTIRRGPSKRVPQRRYDDEEYASDAYEGSSLDEDEFEMLDSRSMRIGGSRRAPEIKKFKVKCHSGDDTRMIMINANVDFDEFVVRLKDKFGFKKKVRCKVKDEDGEGMIGLADQEDLDMVIATAKKNAKKERLDTGKIEVWVQEV
ncbi:hypothetical protein BDZ91DRAFT_794270 [Kalaharituber pfeilii]|nr:hypothetical protein BDZ91DRAFT_794270 [Kalaharituber pfeilii]